MSDKPVLLSISMLVSGREEMEKSLDSLSCFKAAFPCEIILVDTGCNAGQRAAAERYADKLIDFVWCDDFAAARNAGLQEAKGEWFLYLDDDEWFEDPREIITFFTSGEYKRYSSASYIVRNYTDQEGTMYYDTYPSRMCRLEPETRFVGKIHEVLMPFKEPRKVFSDFVHHYGYVYRNEEEKRRREIRNIKPLLEMTQQYPLEPRWSAQLAQEYYTNKQYEAAFLTARKWLKMRRNAGPDGEREPVLTGCIYAFALLSLHAMGRYEEEEEWLGKALAEPWMRLDFMEPTAAFFYMTGARLYNRTDRDGLCREYMERYMDSFRRLRDDRQAVERGTASVVAAVFQENFLYGIVLTVMGSLIRTEDHRLAEEAFYTLDWQDKRLLGQRETELDMVDAVSSVPFHPLWVKMLQTLVSRGNGMQEMLAVFKDMEAAYEKAGMRGKLEGMRRIVAKLEFNHSYLLCTRILWAAQDPEGGSEEERTRQIEGLLEQMFERYPHEVLQAGTGVWKAAEQRGISLERFFYGMDYLSWKHGLEAWCLEASLEEIERWDMRTASWKGPMEANLKLFWIKRLEGRLYRYEEAGYALEELEGLFWEFGDAVAAFYGPCYQEAVLEEIPELLQEDLQLALRLKILRQYREQKDDLNALRSVRRCLGIYPLLGDAVRYYAGLLRDEARKNLQ